MVKIHGSENARCIRQYMNNNAINPNTPVTFGAMLAMEDDYEKNGAPNADKPIKEEKEKED